MTTSIRWLSRTARWRDSSRRASCERAAPSPLSAGISSGTPGSSEAAMVQTTNRFFDEVARLMNDAAGAAQGMRREVETLFRNQAERILRDLDVVKREDFEAVKDLAREENEALKARVAALEAALGKAGTPGATSSTQAAGGTSSSG